MGIPLPLFHTEMLLPCWFMSTCMVSMVGSLTKLSAALTRISSAIVNSKSLTKDLVQAWHELDQPVFHFLGGIVEDPQLLVVVLDTPDVSVWSEQNMLELSFLLVNLFNRLFVFGGFHLQFKFQMLTSLNFPILF